MKSSKKSKAIIRAIMLAVCCAVATGTSAQTADSNEQLKSEVAKLKQIVEQQQSVLDQLLAAKQKQQTVSVEQLAAQPAPAPAPGLLAGWSNNRPGLRSADGRYELNIGGFGHFDYRGYESGNHPPNTFVIRRVRLFVEGKLDKYFDYKVEADFADTTSTPLRDGWVRIHRFEALQFQFGQFKEPFSQEELRSDQVQDFVERSMANNLAPSRSPGFMVNGVIGKGLFEYQAGLFNGKGILTSDSNGTPETVARIRLTPFKRTKNDWVNAFSFGAAAASGRNAGNNVLGIKGQTESKSMTFVAPDTVSGSYYRANGEATWVKGPAAIRSEYDYVSQSRTGLGQAGSNLADVSSTGFATQATYLLTGERKSDIGAVVPKSGLFSTDGKGLGAWELKFRYSFLDVNDQTAKSNRASTYLFGANWYMNRFVKNVLDVGVEHYRDPARTPNPGEQNYLVVMNRIQVAF